MTRACPRQGVVVWATAGGGIEAAKSPWEDYYLVKTDNFTPVGSLGAEILRAEDITRFRL